MPKGNAEYQRLLELLNSNPNYRTMLDSISKSEGTWNKDSYHTHYGGSVNKDKNVKNRKVVSRNGIKSSADGKYQFLNDTWDEKSKKLGLTGFSPEEQDVAAFSLIEDTEALKHIDNGDMDKAIYSLSSTWASLPKDASGKSFYNGQKAKPLKTVLGYMKSNESARAEINKGYKDLNEKNVKNYDAPGFKESIQKYQSELKKIKSKTDLSDVEKNVAVQALNNKTYREGNMMRVNFDINETNKKYNTFLGKLQSFADKGNEDFIDENGGMNITAGVITKKEFEGLKTQAKQFGIDLGNPEFQRAGGDPNNKKATQFLRPEFFNKKIKEINKLKPYQTMEPGVLKYGKTKEEYDAEVAATAPQNTGGLESDIDNGTVATTSSKSPEELAKIKEDQAKSAKLADEVLAAKKKPPTTFSELDNSYTQEIFTDPKFKYTPGKAEIPFDALLGLTTGMMGAAAADVDIKYRDEQVGEGLLQYAADVAKIKNMGLPPEIEGDLKMKLSSAYQTGITNIVRASNGNRNLVLGNQGQLDQARMSGIVEIATLDIDRRDKALAAFGEAQKYISEFDAKRDISNNERKYAEDQKTQLAGAQLAQTGMANFIDAISHAKENGPGSANDMKKQLMQFHASGLIKGAKAGEPGSPEYEASMTLQKELSQGKVRSFNDWTSTLNREQQDTVNNILLKHPEKNPTKNKEATLEDLITFTKEVTGDAQYESEYRKHLGISTLTTSAIKEDVANIQKESQGSVPDETAVPKEKQYADAKTEVMPIALEKFTGQAELKGKPAEHRTTPPLVDANGNALINGVPQKVKGMIVGTGASADSKVADATLLGGLIDPKKEGLKPENIDKSVNDAKLRLANANKRLDDYMTNEQPKILNHIAESEKRQTVFQEGLRKQNIQN
jgi:muramidase (phage lysozyme)